MCTTKIWTFIKLFDKETYADQFVKGHLHFNTLGCFKKRENEYDDGRADPNEGVAKWLQPSDILVNIKGLGTDIPIEITKGDLAGPVSIAFRYHDYLNILCMYAVHTTGFRRVAGTFHCEPHEVDELQRQLNFDDKCLELGKFAVMVVAAPFLDRLSEACRSHGYRTAWRLVEYYDDETFSGAITENDIPFKKQKRFAHQREFRFCVDTGTRQNEPIKIDIGDISNISEKVDPATLHGRLQLTPDPPASS